MCLVALKYYCLLTPFVAYFYFVAFVIETVGATSPVGRNNLLFVGAFTLFSRSVKICFEYPGKMDRDGKVKFQIVVLVHKRVLLIRWQCNFKFDFFFFIPLGRFLHRLSFSFGLCKYCLTNNLCALLVCARVGRVFLLSPLSCVWDFWKFMAQGCHRPLRKSFHQPWNSLHWHTISFDVKLDRV